MWHCLCKPQEPWDQSPTVVRMIGDKGTPRYIPGTRLAIGLNNMCWCVVSSAFLDTSIQIFVREDGDGLLPMTYLCVTASPGRFLRFAAPDV